MSLPEQVEELARLLVESLDLYMDRGDSDPAIVLFTALLVQQAKEQSK